MRCKHIVAYILFLSNAVHKHSFYIHHFCFCILPFFSQENMSFFWWFRVLFTSRIMLKHLCCRCNWSDVWLKSGASLTSVTSNSPPMYIFLRTTISLNFRELYHVIDSINNEQINASKKIYYNCSFIILVSSKHNQFLNFQYILMSMTLWLQPLLVVRVLKDQVVPSLELKQGNQVSRFLSSSEGHQLQYLHSHDHQFWMILIYFDHVDHNDLEIIY